MQPLASHKVMVNTQAAGYLVYQRPVMEKSHISSVDHFVVQLSIIPWPSLACSALC